MTTEDQIRQRLEANFTIIDLKIKNESHKHSGHAGDNGTGQSHFKVEITAKELIDCTRVQSQRKVNAVLIDLFEQDLHALSLKIG